MERTLRDLDNPTKNCVYIVSENESDEEDEPFPTPYSPHSWRDLPNGHDLRMEAYQKAWTRCLTRVQSVVRALHEPVAAEVVKRVYNAYSDILPGLPFVELPVIAISAESGSFSLYTEILRRLEHDDPGAPRETASDEFGLSTYVNETVQVHLYPADCPNLMTAMKAIVTGFVDQHDGPERSMKRRPATSLATYDINLLGAWYDALGTTPHLVIVLHDFEQYDPVVMQDVFYICSLHIPRLPIVFILGLSSPPFPSYVHATYPRSTLALLRMRTISAPSGWVIVEELINKIFFDAGFQPDVMIGPGTTQFIADFASRNTASLDALLTMLQIAHMKHFAEPLTALTHSSLLGSHNTATAAERLAHPSCRPFLEALRARLAIVDPEVEEADSQVLLETVDAARESFYRNACRVRMGLHMTRIVRKVGLEAGTFSALAGKREEDADGLAFANAVLRGRASRDVRFQGLVLKKLSSNSLRILIEELCAFFQSLRDSDALVLPEHEEALVWLEGALAELPPEQEEMNDDDARMSMVDAEEITSARRDPAVVQIAEALGEWLVNYLEGCFVRLDEGPLWDIWYTGLTPFPDELINPVPRATIVSALVHPYDFARAHTDLVNATHNAPPAHDAPNVKPTYDHDASEEEYGDETEQVPALWQLPDTTILFRRYLEAGRLINAYDWYEAFAQVLDNQKRHLCLQARVQAESRASGKGKGRARAMPIANADDEDEGNDEDVEDEESGDEEQAEAWQLELQARFIRALHTLDLLGLIKHTGRKADHVMRTVWDVVDV
ncbi:uncharacterized protein LAESUDRAFT_813778 [Laetiporus sulphureus 93-53]|uniref:Uncharacterized protein n=1 Tax=Laetiporus sulphureus 93-53 TaxID=1314785 RepID=A0A165DHE0_9APHY|nr:uncharacterized protein LAESUDRAFT_813778 [Laetiporus sulphureus 93-53]KZT04882.1 hypothetical protein LAESUDRAFT_813778 [Laetiporus sulphureus 93-53]